jgi:transcriptional regulator with XRE-family HTH domain
MPPQRLAQVIQRLRKAKDMTQPELARKARVSHGYIGQLESGPAVMTP